MSWEETVTQLPFLLLINLYNPLGKSPVNTCKMAMSHMHGSKDVGHLL